MNNSTHNTIKIFLGSDHRGFEVKQMVMGVLEAEGISFQDMGNSIQDKDDNYPEFALEVAHQVVQNDNALGILVCGTGIGMCISANKVDTIRAAVCHCPEDVAFARSHNHINILCLAADSLNPEYIVSMVKMFVQTSPSQEKRHIRRVQMISSIETNN